MPAVERIARFPNEILRHQSAQPAGAIRVDDFVLFGHDTTVLDDEIASELGRVAARKGRDEDLL